MKATKQSIYTQGEFAHSPFFWESSNSLIINTDSIRFPGKVIPIDVKINSAIKSVNEIVKEALLVNGKVPDVLLLDLGLEDINVQELIDLSGSIAHKSRFCILWNAVHLSITDMQYLLQLGIVDDFFEDIEDVNLIEKKVQFLFKYKQNTISPKLLEVDDFGPLKEGYSRLIFFKRMFDIAISLILLVLLIPLFILVGLAIKIESRGPIFYISKRVGRHYRIFPMIKFRSMCDGADQALGEMSNLNMYGSESKSSAFVKIKDDPRVSEVGKFLRKTSIDEFPQLLNVLMGHMSIVGNRPLPLYEAEKLLVNDYVSRFDAPAGITGLWQVIKKEKPDLSEQDRIDLDIKYSKEFSFLNDLSIILKTPAALLQNQNY
jgi:lipopolysaccharide/colanic/teichoic acid biosynthesis glycosyltransferase